MLYAAPAITIYSCCIAALLGACMGSFLNCAAWRIVHGESVLRGRSHCDVCGHVLAPRDLVPVFSYVFSHGRCRYCGAKLSPRHAVGEAVAALVFVSLLLRYDISLRTLEAWAVACLLLACAFADLEGYIIPDRFIAVGVVLFIVTLFFVPDPGKRALDGLIGGVAVGGGVLLLALLMEKLLRRDAMGGGDIKLLFLTGLFLGWQKNLLCLLLACVSKTKKHSKIHRRQVRSSFAGAEMGPDKKRPAENTCRIVKGLDAVWAHFCPPKPCLPLSIDGIGKRGSPYEKNRWH